MSRLLQDFRYALRQLRRSPGFAITAVLTLALGVGANSAIFSLLDQALLRSLPVREPGRLVLLQSTNKAWTGRSSSHGGDVRSYFSYPMYRDLRDRAGVFFGLASTTTTAVGIAQHDQPSVEDAELVSGNYFNVLGTQAAHGRVFNDGDDQPGTDHQVAVVSYGFWQRRLGADAAAVGSTLRVNGLPTRIVGVAAPNFHSAVWGQTPAVFLPMAMVPQLDLDRPKALTDHKDRWLNIVGRLRDGLSRERAEAQVEPLWHALRSDEFNAIGQSSPRFKDSFVTKNKLELLPGDRGLSYRREGLQTPLLVVMGMAALVLLIASVNVASLLLVRSSGRVREFAVRYALGATAQRVLAQLLMEGLLIGLLGAVSGALLAPLAMHTVANHLVDPGDTTYFSANLDLRVLLFSFATAMVVSTLFSVAPALQLLKPDMVGSLKQQAGTASGARLGLRRMVVGLQIGLSVLLLVGAGLFVRTLANLRKVDVGFNTSHLLSFGIDPQLAGIPQERVPALYDEVLQRLAAQPGVVSVGVTDTAELTNSNGSNNVSVQGYTRAPEEEMNALVENVSPDFFKTLQIPIVAGRSFQSGDNAKGQHVAIVNRSFADKYLHSPGQAIGSQMASGEGKHLDWLRIVGVADDMHHSGLRDEIQPSYYVPLQQSERISGSTIYLRTIGAPLEAAAMTRNTMHGIDPGLALTNVRTMDQTIESDLTNERMIELLAVSFSVLATALAGIGLYGVLAFSVAQRTREIGIRMALGSTRALVARLVVADVLKLTGVGIAVALPLALLAARALRSQLYGVSATDPWSAVAAVGLIALVALVAAALPARRAATVQPDQALRTE